VPAITIVQASGLTIMPVSKEPVAINQAKKFGTTMAKIWFVAVAINYV
jgi:hypothetical protein